MSINRLKYFYYGFLVATFLVSILSVYILKQNNMLMNIIELENYNEFHVADHYSDSEKLKSILPLKILQNDKIFEDDIKKTMNYVATVIDGRYTSNPHLTAYQKLNNILHENGGGICGDLAMILKEILEVKGYTARTIQLIRQLGSSYDTHVLTEVWDSQRNKFIVLDPTFHIMFQSNNQYINANEVKNIFLYKKETLNIEESVQQKVAKYKEYYVDYFSLYNNVLIVKANSQSGYKRLISKLPIFHNYLGRKYYVEKDSSLYGVSKLYKIFYFYIPLFLLLNIVAIILIKIKNMTKRQS